MIAFTDPGVFSQTLCGAAWVNKRSMRSDWDDSAKISDTVCSCNRGEFLEPASNTCQPCPTGKYQKDVSVVKEASCAYTSATCPPGTYASATSSTCRVCSRGRFSNRTGITAADQCQACAAGRWSDERGLAEGSLCTACPEGRFSGQPPGQVNPSSCDGSCSAGKYSSVAGITSDEQCTLCGLGKWSDKTARVREAQCNNCTIGTWTPFPGAAACELGCPPGTFVTGSSPDLECIVCPAGKYQPEGRTAVAGSGDDPSSICTACAPGRFVSDNGTVATLHAHCANCSAGFEFSSTVTPCTPCPNGWHQDRDGTRAAATCRLCAAGKRFVDARSACEECGVGRYQPSNAAPGAACSVCGIGRVAIHAGMDACVDCGVNTYNGFGDADTDQDKHDAADDCVACPTGQLTDGETGLPFCSPCPAGSKTVHNETTGAALACTSCLAGYFQPLAGNATCIACPAGQYQEAEGKPFCLPCIPGRANNLEGQKECEICPVHTFSGKPEATVCENCGVGEKTLSNGSAACQPCPAGEAGTPCAACAKGQYRTSGMGSSSCTLCPEGYHQNAEGQASCLPCVPGKANALAGQNECAECDIGRAQGVQNQETCFECPEGRRPQARGSAACSPCSTGTHRVGNSSNAACRQCPAGWSQAELDQGACTQCAIGQTAVIGVASCSGCNIGTFGSSPGVCSTCPHGQYQDAKGEKSCVMCTRGQQYVAAMTPCAQCELGTYGSSDGTCTACSPGLYQDGKGARSCKPCPVDTFNPNNASTSLGECVQCSVQYRAHTTTGNRTGVDVKEAGCVCAGARADGGSRDDVRGYFTANTSKALGGLCEVCPDGAVCDRDGMRLDAVMAQPGHWRPPLRNPKKKFPRCSQGYRGNNAQTLAKARCCPGQTCRNLTSAKLQANPDAQCLRGYSGVLCLACANGYVKVGDDCRACDGPPDVGLAFAIVGACCVALFVGVFLYLVVCGSKAESNVKKVSAVFGQVKIAISFVQIVSSLPHVMGGVPFPGAYIAFTVPFTAVNLDLVGLMSFSACRLALGFLAQTIVHLSVPPLLIAALIAAYTTANVCRKPKDAHQRAHRRAEVAKILILGTLLLCKSCRFLVVL